MSEEIEQLIKFSKQLDEMYNYFLREDTTPNFSDEIDAVRVVVARRVAIKEGWLKDTKLEREV